jgi:WD40 repeat protein
MTSGYSLSVSVEMAHLSPEEQRWCRGKWEQLRAEGPPGFTCTFQTRPDTGVSCLLSADGHLPGGLCAFLQQFLREYRPHQSLALGDAGPPGRKSWSFRPADPAGGRASATTALRAFWNPVVILRLSAAVGGERLAVVGDDGRVRMVDLQSAEQWYQSRGHTHAASRHDGVMPAVAFEWPTGAASVAWSPDGTRLAVGFEEGTIGIWGPSSSPHELFNWRGHTDAVTSLSWSPDGGAIAAACEEEFTASVWEAATGRLLYRSQEREPYAVAWSPDGERLLVACSDCTLRVLAAGRHGEELLCAQCESCAHSLAWSPQGDWALSLQDDGSVCLWNTRTNVIHIRGMWDTRLLDAAWSTGGQFVSVVGQDRAQVWRLEDVPNPGASPVGIYRTEGARAVVWGKGGVLLFGGCDGLTCVDSGLRE